MKNDKNRQLSELDKLFGPTNNTRKLSQRTKDNIMKLGSLATKGAQDAATELHSTAVLTVEILTWLCEKSPQPFKEIAREKFNWPVLCNLHPEQMRETASFLKKMELGANTQINFSSGKTFSWRVPANAVALNLHKLAQNLQRAPMRRWNLRDHTPIVQCGIGRISANVIHVYNAKYEEQLKRLEEWGQHGAGKHLPPLSKETAAQWATAAKELFKIAYPGNFEEHPNLQELRASVLRRAKDAYGETRRGVIRKAMLQAVKQTWHSIAAVGLNKV